MLGQDRGIIAQMFTQKLIVTHELLTLAQETDAMVGIVRVKSHHIDTLLLGAPVVVLGLDLQEIQARVYIGADAQLLSPDMPVLVHDVHIVVGRVKIGGIIAGNALAINLLNAVIITGKHQQKPQPVNRCNKLGVSSVHQLDATHLVECNRVVSFDDVVHWGAKI